MALIPMGRKLLSGPQAGMSGFPELMMVMHTLAGAGNGAGHLDLFQAATSWLQIWSVLLSFCVYIVYVFTIQVFILVCTCTLFTSNSKKSLEKKEVLEEIVDIGSSSKVSWS